MNMAELQNEFAALHEWIYFDEQDYLREKTTDVSKVEACIANAKQLVDAREGKRDVLYGMIGNLYRICEEPQKAEPYLRTCVELAVADADRLREIVSLLRLGEALKYADKKKEAMVLFEEAYAKCHAYNVQQYVDFALQHKGKCLMELGELEEAEACFVRALTLRELKAIPSLIESTKKALAFVRA